MTVNAVHCSFCSDLAGSEEISKSLGTNPDPERRQESIAINSSLSALTTVMTYLSKGKRPSYRESPLTHILKDSLGGNSKTVMFVACSPHIYNRSETIRTLRFASCAKKVRNKATRNEEPCSDILKQRIKDLEGKVLKLEALLLEERLIARKVSKMLNSTHSFSPGPESPVLGVPASPTAASLSPQNSLAAPSRPTLVSQSTLLQSVTESVACATVGTVGSPAPSVPSLSAAIEVTDREGNEYGAVLAVDALLKAHCGDDEELQNIREIGTLRKRLNEVMEENQSMSEQIKSKNQELHDLSHRMEALEEAQHGHRLKGGAVSRQQSNDSLFAPSYFSQRKSAKTPNNLMLSNRPTVTDDEERSDFPVPPLPDDYGMRSNSHCGPGAEPPQNYQHSESHGSYGSASQLNQYSLPQQCVAAPNVSVQPHHASPSSRRLSVLQNKLLNYLCTLQQHIERQPFRDSPDSRHSSVSTPATASQFNRVSRSASGAEFDVLNDDELAELMRLNQKGARRASQSSAISTISEHSMGHRDPLDDLDADNLCSDMTRIRQKRIVERRRHKGQIRRASAPVLPASMMNSILAETQNMRNSILAPINENSSIAGKSRKSGAQSTARWSMATTDKGSRTTKSHRTSRQRISETQGKITEAAEDGDIETAQ